MEYISSLDKAYSLPTQGRRVCILGSTGSIGRTTLKVIEKKKEIFSVVGLAAGENIYQLAEQAVRFRPLYLCVKCEELIDELKSLLPLDYSPEIVAGQQGYRLLASLESADIVVLAQSGAAGLSPTLSALEKGKVVALANKESLVLAGPLIKKICRQTGASILPIDSEHNAIFQIIKGQDFKEIERIILTASGGPFFGKDKEFLKSVTPKMALAHPNWSMGPKITVDSATLMNKGLEVIEAHYLYGIELDRIDVVIHRESIIHSMVEFHDGSVFAQMSLPDMGLPIAYCLSFPNRLPFKGNKLKLSEMGNLSFAPPDNETFPMLDLATEALRMGESYPIALNAANEVAVDAFLAKRISFLDIVRLNEMALQRHRAREISSLEDILDIDKATRIDVQKLIERLY
jgi:1-deoxy-D-xylulose-5-phosphate reductoisomerase